MGGHWRLFSDKFLKYDHPGEGKEKTMKGLARNASKIFLQIHLPERLATGSGALDTKAEALAARARIKATTRMVAGLRSKITAEFNHLYWAEF